MSLRIAHALLPEGLVEDVFLAWDEAGRLTEVRPGRAADGALQGGIAMPGLVNAHLHLELSWVDASGLPTRRGLVPWVDALLERLQGWTTPDLWQARVQRELSLLREAGTAALCDISNTGATAGPIAAAGLQGIVEHELYSLDAVDIPARCAAVRAHGAETHHGPRDTTVVVRPSPHAPYSSDPAIVREVVAWSTVHPEAPPASIHLAEDLEELRFLADGGGAWAAQLDRMERDWAHWQAPGLGPVAWLDGLGALGPQLLLVHGVWLTPQERARVAAAGAPLCLCPRSNLAITGKLPNVAALLEAGVALCLGTDSLASAPDLDVLGEIPLLAQQAPEVPVARWLSMATTGGARALGLAHLGALRVGARPGLVQLHAEPAELRHHAPLRTVHLLAGGA